MTTGQAAPGRAGRVKLSSVVITPRRAQECLGWINGAVKRPFGSPEECLSYYRTHLPERIGDYRQEEVGPVCHRDLPGEAEKFLRGEFTLGQHTLLMKDGLDWYGTPNGDLEWNGGLVRQGYFMLLADEYERTGDEAYAETIVEHLLDYVERVPPFDPDGKPYLEYKKSTWRPFEVAGRVAENWPVALRRIIASPAVTPEAWARILWSVYEHAAFLRKRHWKTGNHAVLEVADLGIVSIFFQEFAEAEAWREYACGFLDRMWPELFHSDGYSKEMSGGYHWVAMRNFFAFYEVARRCGLAGIFPPRYRDRLVSAAYAELYQEKPDFSTPVTNDSNSGTNRARQLERIERVLDLPEAGWRLSGGRRGRKPARESISLPEARMAFMRSGWKADDLYLSFDLGRWGDNHMNEDQLAVEVSAYGRHFLVNGGRWRYTTSDPRAPWMPWARYFKRTASYNSLIVDGYSQMPGDARGGMTITDGYDLADGEFPAGYGEDAEAAGDETLLATRGLAGGMAQRVDDVMHRRQVYFAKKAAHPFWLVKDTVSTGAAERKIEQIWHGMAGRFVAVRPGLLRTDFDDANLFLLAVEADGTPAEHLYYYGSENPMAGWHCPGYDVKIPAPEVRFIARGQGRIVIVTLLLPIRGRPADGDEPGLFRDGDEYEVVFRGEKTRLRLK